MDISANAVSGTPASPTPSALNPAAAPERRITSANRVPMSLPTAKLSVPEVSGYFLYWHLGKNVAKAIRAGYTHVDIDELDVEQKGVANSASESGSTDMGTRISVAAGGTVSDDNPEPERLYLMKLPMEWRAEDMAGQAKVNENVARALRSGDIGADGDADRNKRYMKSGQDLFFPKNRPS